MTYLCCVCDNRSVRNSKFCKDCEIIYKSVEKEPWFVELCSLMSQQRRIDDREKFSIYNLGESNLSEKFKRERGRPRVSKVINELVKNIKRDTPRVTIRQIVEMCKEIDVFISRETIRRILTQ
jgi:hypothetical protein